jgi:hypothetical protein
MTVNTFSRLAALLPPSPLLIAKVLEVHADDTSTIELPLSAESPPLATGLAAGRLVRVRGSLVPAGGNAFVRDGLIESRAPDGDPILVVIGEVAPTPTPGGPPLLQAVGTIADQEFSQNVASVFSLIPYWSDGFQPYTYSVTGTLPAGVTLDATTGQIAGTPTTVGTYTLTPTCTDSTDRSVAQNTFDLAVVYTVPFSAVAIQLEFEGTNGSTTFTDSSSYGLTASVGGSPTITTADSRVGSSCILGAGNAILTFTVGAAPTSKSWCVEAWVKRPVGATNYFGLGNSTLVRFLKLRGATNDSSYKFGIEGNFDGNTGLWLTTVGVPEDTWTHVCASFEHLSTNGSGQPIGTLRLFLNGAKDQEFLSFNSANIVPGALWRIGVANGSFFAGFHKIDSYRLTRGDHRYSDSFAPNTVPHPTS